MAADDNPIRSVWARPQRNRREKPVLSREQIVAAALQLLDAEGIDALSTRKLGAQLGAGATSLYTHVANKDELLELVVNHVYGEIPAPAADDPAGWQEAITRCCHDVRATLLRHPWIVSVLGEAGLAYLGPNVLRLSEAMLAVLEEGGFTPEAADLAMNTVMAYVIGIASSEAATLNTLARSGQSEQQWAERLWPTAEQAVQAYPRLRRRYAARRDQNLSATRNHDFDTGLACILHGLAVHLAPDANHTT